MAIENGSEMMSSVKVTHTQIQIHDVINNVKIEVQRWIWIAQDNEL